MALQEIVLGGGCFWCTEACFLDIKGIVNVESGYSGGHTPNPSYEQVCSESTGHAEVVRLKFDPAFISLDQVLAVFFSIHDPTTLNRQGNDVGTQYRSCVFASDEAQLSQVNAFIERLKADAVFDQPLTTQVALLPNYYAAEAYHQRYFERNPHQGYCMMVVGPKHRKFRKQFAELLR
jgi:peptide-methionine (S)-S-oxide reductase